MQTRRTLYSEEQTPIHLRKPSRLLQHCKKTLLTSVFVSTWCQCFSFWIVFRSQNTTKKKIISIYEVFFQVKAVKLEASANHFYSKVRIPIAKMVRLSVCEITFIWRSNLMLRRKANNYSNLILQCKYIHAFFCLLMAKTIFTYAYKSYHMFN